MGGGGRQGLSLPAPRLAGGLWGSQGTKHSSSPVPRGSPAQGAGKEGSEGEALPPGPRESSTEQPAGRGGARTPASRPHPSPPAGGSRPAPEVTLGEGAVGSRDGGGGARAQGRRRGDGGGGRGSGMEGLRRGAQDARVNSPIACRVSAAAAAAAAAAAPRPPGPPAGRCWHPPQPLAPSRVPAAAAAAGARHRRRRGPGPDPRPLPPPPPRLAGPARPPSCTPGARRGPGERKARGGPRGRRAGGAEARPSTARRGARSRRLGRLRPPPRPHGAPSPPPPVGLRTGPGASRAEVGAAAPRLPRVR